MPGEISRTYDGPDDPVPANKLTDGDMARLESIFGYHKPTGRKADRHELVRTACRRAAGRVLQVAPHSAEREEALKHLRLAMFWANAAIACNPEVPG